MKKYWVILTVFIFALVGICYAQTIPKSVGYVNDFAGVINSLDKAKMQGKIASVKDKLEIAVVTVNSLQGYSVGDLAVAIGKSWGVGKKGVNNGIVILLAPTERKVFIATGYGMEAALTDAVCKRIIEQDMKPYLKKNKFSEGLVVGVDAVISKFKEKGGK